VGSSIVKYGAAGKGTLTITYLDGIRWGEEVDMQRAVGQSRHPASAISHQVPCAASNHFRIRIRTDVHPTRRSECSDAVQYGH